MHQADRVRQFVEHVTSRPGYTSAAGTEVVLARPGEAHLRLRRRQDLLQFNGFFHGGVIAGLADHAAGAAVSTALPEGQIAITVDLHVNYVAPADGDAILARAHPVQLGSTLCVAQVHVYSCSAGAEKLCAICLATLRSVRHGAAVSLPGAQRP